MVNDLQTRDKPHSCRNTTVRFIEIPSSNSLGKKNGVYSFVATKVVSIDGVLV